MIDDRRSLVSKDFEAIWHDLRLNGLPLPIIAAADFVHFWKHLPNLAVAGLNLDLRKMPIIFAGSSVCEFVGFELRGHDFLDLDIPVNEEEAWIRRRDYHKMPVGRYEELGVTFRDGNIVHCALTSLPIHGPSKDLRLATLLEVREFSIEERKDKGKLTGKVDYASAIELGGGLSKW